MAIISEKFESSEKFYGLKYDIAFKKAFVENNDLLKGFISDMLDIPLNELGEVTVENPDLVPDEVDGKYSRLDIKAAISNQIVNIEMQVANTQGFEKRVMYYWAGIYHEQLKAGQPYSSLKKTISMNVLSYTKFTDYSDYHSKYVLYDRKHSQEMEDILEVHFFEISKAVKEKQSDKKHLWLKLINADSKEALDELLEHSEEGFIKKGVQVVSNMNADTNFKTIIRMREEAMHERDSLMYESEQKGIAKGMAEERQRMADFMRLQGVSEEIIQKYLSMNDSIQ